MSMYTSTYKTFILKTTTDSNVNDCINKYRHIYVVYVSMDVYSKQLNQVYLNQILNYYLFLYLSNSSCFCLYTM